MATWKKVITDGLSLSDIGTPASDDKVLIQDTSDSDIVKYVDFGDIGGAGGLSDVVDDTSPQLGGNLDLNSNDITGTGNVNITGGVTVSGNGNLGGLVLGTTGMLSLGSIQATNITGTGNGSISGTLTVGSDATFSSNLFASGLQFVGNGTNTIHPANTGGTQTDLQIESNGNVTIVLDDDDDETDQAFKIQSGDGTVIFQVNESGVTSGLLTSATPTISTISDFESSQTSTITVSNYDSDSTYAVKLYNSSNALQSHTITNNNNGTWTIASGLSPATGYYVTIQAQKIGEFISALATSNTFESQAAQTQMRYWRLQMTDASKNPVNSMVALGDFRLYTATGGGGTAYPSNMTSETAPTPYVVTKGYEYGTYLAWKAMDGGGSSASSMWWTISISVAANNWIQIDLGSSIDFGSGECQITTSGGWTSANYAVLYGSNTGDFSGEEREMAFFQNIDKAGESGGTFTTYTESIS